MFRGGMHSLIQFTTVQAPASAGQRLLCDYKGFWILSTRCTDRYIPIGVETKSLGVETVAQTLVMEDSLLG